MQVVLEIKATKEIKELLARSPELVRRGLALAGQHVVRKVKQKLSGEVLRVRTNRLRGSITSEVRGEKTLELVVGTNVIYARIHEFGGVIVPKKAKFLHFIVGGREVFAKKVTIPKRPYMEPAMKESLQDIVRIIGETVEKGLKSGAS